MSYYAFQEQALARWRELAEPARLILAWPTGSGKSRVALECTRDDRVLVVAPALALGSWAQQCEKWLGEPAGIYDKSLARKQLSKKERARLAQALDCRVLITTPHFAFDLDQARTLVLDEGDMYANPGTERSLGLRAYLARYSNTRALLLTATLFPKEIRDVWNPVQSLFPRLLPVPPREHPDKVPFAFLHKFAGRSELGYFSGTRNEALPLLRSILESVSSIVSEEEVLRVVPPLQLHALAGDHRTYGQWLGEHANVRSLCAVTWTRAKAEEYAARMRAEGGRYVVCLHGGSDPQERWRVLQELRSEYCTGAPIGLVCTAASVLVNLSLAFFERALIVDWRRTPREVLQLLGRFRRPDEDKRVPSVVDLLVEDGQAGAMQSAIERLSAFQALLGPSANAESFTSALRQGTQALLDTPLSAEDIREMFASRVFESEGASELFAEELTE